MQNRLRKPDKDNEIHIKRKTPGKKSVLCIMRHNGKRRRKKAGHAKSNNRTPWPVRKEPALLHCRIAFPLLSCWTKWKEPTMAQGCIRQSPPYAPYGHSTSIPFGVSQDRNSNLNNSVYTYCLQLSLEAETAQRQSQRRLLRSVGHLQWEKVGP